MPPSAPDTPATKQTGDGAKVTGTSSDAEDASTPRDTENAGTAGDAAKDGDTAKDGKAGDGKAGDGKRALSGIGAVACRTGVSERTLRYYEELGLLRPTAHRRGGSRLYCEADVERVEHIRELQALMGFNLEEIRGIVAATDRLDALRDEYHGTADSGHQRELLEEAASTLEDLRAQVLAKRDHLQSFLSRLDARIERNKSRLASSMDARPGSAGGHDGAVTGTEPLAYGPGGTGSDPSSTPEDGRTSPEDGRTSPAGEPAR